MDPGNHHNDQLGSDDQRLGALFAAYREACPDPEPGANFMPVLWQRIEARERSSGFGRIARNLVTAALAVSSLLAFAVSISQSYMAQLPEETYVEVLSEDHLRQDLDYFDTTLIEPIAERR
jgi:hypothetical protein